jgi:SAM-dependent methyltransferase
MQPYSGFASVYDLFMDNVPYEEWADYVQKLLKKNKIENGLVLELGCGTGSMTRRLADRGYDMIGIDYSEEMLAIARENSSDDYNILYLCQDMRDFELYGTVAAVVSVCDSMNYILSEDELRKVFRLVNNYLDPSGLFIFDLDTEYAYREVLGDNTIAENREEGSFIWENTYYEDEMVNEVNLTLFLPEEEDLYRRYEETHYRKAYSIEGITRLIEEAGMELVAVYDMLTEKKPKKDSERVYFIAREKRQADKMYL